jgi:hypothetical protein
VERLTAPPGQRNLIEVKYARQPGDFKTIEQEVMIDSIAYLKGVDRYRELIVFIYDEAGAAEHYDLTRRALLQLAGVTDVIIVTRPGMLLAPDRKRRTRTRKSEGTDPAP